jgi:hypothetical protein
LNEEAASEDGVVAARSQVELKTVLRTVYISPQKVSMLTKRYSIRRICHPAHITLERSQPLLVSKVA